MEPIPYYPFANIRKILLPPNKLDEKYHKFTDAQALPHSYQ